MADAVFRVNIVPRGPAPLRYQRHHGTVLLDGLLDGPPMAPGGLRREQPNRHRAGLAGPRGTAGPGSAGQDGQARLIVTGWLLWPAVS
jgi:hypothetical protein